MSLAVLKHKGAVQPPRYTWITDNIASNYVLYSEDFTIGTGWTTIGATISPNQTIAPDGTLTADALIGDGLGANHFVQVAVLGLTVGDAYTEIWHAKKGAVDYALIQVQYGSIGNVYFDLTNGTVGTVVGGNIIASGIEPADNDFYRFYVTFIATATTTAFRIFSSDGDGGASYKSGTGAEIYIWGAQFDNYAALRAYRKTTGAAIFNRRDRTRSSTIPYSPSATPTENNIIYHSKGAVQPAKINLPSLSTRESRTVPTRRESRSLFVSEDGRLNSIDENRNIIIQEE